ncbi:hypothetical protein TNCV_2460271 [Trichonephila clavipes]|nr:hypothetical protein TNCV_2460271 [Trichonephila clavipes]
MYVKRRICNCHFLLSTVASGFHVLAGRNINTRIQSCGSAELCGDVSVANPMLSREELIDVYYESAFGRKLVSTADIMLNAFFPYSRRESFKCHRVLSIMVHRSSIHSRLNWEKPIPQSNCRWCSTNTFL